MNPTYHFIGIGGIGMSALARILVQKGEPVTGSDARVSPITEELEQLGVKIHIGQAQENISANSQVIYSSDILKTNPEFARAVELGLPILHRSELLRDLMLGQKALLVAGAHGKTTTSSLLAHVLIACGLSPSFAVGGIVASIGCNGGYGNGHYFVAEADESDGSFLKYLGFGAILTNIDNDHLAYWKSTQGLIEGFQRFAKQITSSEHLFWCKDDDKLDSLGLNGVSYGFSEEADLFIIDYLQDGWSNSFDFRFKGKEYLGVELPLIGAYNVLNAAAVFGMALSLDIPEAQIRKAIASFKGIGRRIEKKAEINGISIFDDYAHHPTEIFATLRALKNAVEGRRLVVAFQPHRYTRTHDCMMQFQSVFGQADVLFLTDIYSAGEPPIPGVTTQALLGKIHEAHPKQGSYIPRKELAKSLAKFLKPQDVLVTMGAGDITKLAKELMDVMNG